MAYMIVTSMQIFFFSYVELEAHEIVNYFKDSDLSQDALDVTVQEDRSAGAFRFRFLFIQLEA